MLLSLLASMQEQAELTYFVIKKIGSTSSISVGHDILLNSCMKRLGLFFSDTENSPLCKYVWILMLHTTLEILTRGTCWTGRN